MNVVAWVAGIVMVVVFGGAGITKIVDLDRARERLGYPRNEFRLIGVGEVLGAIGLIVGLVSRRFEFVAITAGVCLAILMLGALMAHARAGDDSSKAIPAGVMFVVTVLFLIFISVR